MPTALPRRAITETRENVRLVVSTEQESVAEAKQIGLKTGYCTSGDPALDVCPSWIDRATPTAPFN